MSRRWLAIRLKGGLGNQMFQYAAGRAAALRNGMELVLDTTGGFARDRVFRRSYALGGLPVAGRPAGRWTRLLFLSERMCQRCGIGGSSVIQRRPWGTALLETGLRFRVEVAECVLGSRALMDGYWQSESYFSDQRETVGQELAPPAPSDPRFLSMARQMEACESVAVGVRLFEEMPGADKAGVGGLVPLSSYVTAASCLGQAAGDTVFFVFCTTSTLLRDHLKLPGQTVYVTPEEGYGDALQVLWLLTRCRHHIIANSSFFWWGAWLAEQHRAGTVVVCGVFPNEDTVPPRWVTSAPPGGRPVPECRSA